MRPAYAVRPNDAGGPAWWPRVVTWPVGWLVATDHPTADDHPGATGHPAPIDHPTLIDHPTADGTSEPSGDRSARRARDI